MTAIAGSATPLDVLWTGGWDSTYRILDAVLHHRYPVQPWYVLDTDRESTQREVETMEAIRTALAQRDPEAAAHIRETKFVRVEDIAPDDELIQMYKALPIGSQYGWLARLAKQEGLKRLELGAIGGSGGRLRQLLGESIEEVQGATGTTFRLGPALHNPALELFRRFEFPILNLSKEDIRRRSTEQGFLDLMQMTWFCHTPKQDEPCGMCTPCMVAMKSKMAWRIPPLRRIRPLLRIAKASARSSLERKFGVGAAS